MQMAILGLTQGGMMKKLIFFLLGLLMVSSSRLLAEEDASQKKDSSPIKGIASGVKNIAYDAPKDLAAETVKEAPKKPPLVNVVEGINKGTEKFIDHTIKGAYKVVTLGTSELESYEVQEPEKGSGEPTKFKISIPGT